MKYEGQEGGRGELQGSWTSRKSVLSLIFDRAHYDVGYKIDTLVISFFFLHFGVRVGVGGISLQQINFIHDLKYRVWGQRNLPRKVLEIQSYLYKTWALNSLCSFQ